MASYQELFDLRQDSDLLNKISTAIAIASKAVIDDGTKNAAQRNWAREAVNNPRQTAEAEVIWLVLVANKAASVAQITGASDAAVQSAVDTAVADITKDLA